MPGFQPLGRPRPALGCEAGVGDGAGNVGGIDVGAVVVLIAAVFTVGACIDDDIDGLISCLGRGTGVGFGAGFDDVAVAAVVGINGLDGNFCE